MQRAAGEIPMAFTRFATILAVLLLTTGMALAQSQPQNPLRPRAAPAAPAATAAPATATTEAGAKPKRARSEAQLANDRRMKACGAEWRANKAALTAQGKTWRTYNVECRARLKSQGA